MSVALSFPHKVWIRLCRYMWEFIQSSETSRIVPCCYQFVFLKRIQSIAKSCAAHLNPAPVAASFSKTWLGCLNQTEERWGDDTSHTEQVKRPQSPVRMNGLSLMGCTHACNFSVYQGNSTSCLSTLPAESHKKAKHVPNQPLFFYQCTACSHAIPIHHVCDQITPRIIRLPNVPGPYFLSGW